MMKTVLVLCPLSVALALAAPAQTSAPPSLAVAAMQTALDRQGFGVGFIDGQRGPRTDQALRDFSQARGLTKKAAQEALKGDSEDAVTRYTVTAADIETVGSAPSDWEEAAEVPAMAFRTLDEALSERFHASKPFLRHLNPKVAAWDSSLVGAPVTVPNVRPATWHPPASRLEVDCQAYRLRAFDTNDALLASFPCSIALNPSRIPQGDLRIAAFAPDPIYTFDPANFPESARAQEIGRKLIVPAGPRNPVGVYWLSLSAPGFGMHGTPHPETIGRRESHGCFRLTNWDVVTVAGMVAVGTPVRVRGVPTGDAEP